MFRLNEVACLSQIHTNPERTIYSFLPAIDDHVNGIQLDAGNRAETVPSGLHSLPNRPFACYWLGKCLYKESYVWSALSPVFCRRNESCPVFYIDLNLCRL